MPLALQAKLLRFLQERVIERVGGRQEIPVDVRVICATHKDLLAMSREKEFREDLYYRISEITVRIPALREREGDVLLLARVFLEQFQQAAWQADAPLQQGRPAAMEAYPWPGNVRELENRVKRAVIMAENKQITAGDLELGGTGHDERASFNLREIRDQAEGQAVVRALGHVGGKVSQAAELLGVSRPTMYDLLKKQGRMLRPRSGLLQGSGRCGFRRSPVPRAKVSGPGASPTEWAPTGVGTLRFS
jgi:two-component system, NtrC family, response regulator